MRHSLHETVVGVAGLVVMCVLGYAGGWETAAARVPSRRGCRWLGAPGRPTPVLVVGGLVASVAHDR